MTAEPDLNAALVAAHEQRDAACIAELYHAAGQAQAARGQMDAACFFWTQGYVWALEAGSSRAPELHALLKAEGREA